MLTTDQVATAPVLTDPTMISDFEAKLQLLPVHPLLSLTKFTHCAGQARQLDRFEIFSS